MPADLQLGKLHHIHDNHTLLLEHYTAQLPTPPPSLDYSSKVQEWPMYGNDKYGDCTCAAIGHMTELFAALSGASDLPTEQEIVAAYAAITGFDPQSGVNDNGASEIDVLNWWRRNPIGGQKIFAFTEISDPTQHQVVQQALQLFGGVYVGVAMPLTVQQQFKAGLAWDVVSSSPSQNGPGTWGGHAINAVGYDAAGVLCVSWGKVVRLTWAFWDAYVDEAWGVLTAEWQQSPPAGFDWNTLVQDLVQLGVG